MDWTHVSVTGWAGLVYVGVFGPAAATALWVRSIERWGTQATMNYTYLEPVTGVAIAAIVLGDRLFPIQGVGAALVLAGISPLAEETRKPGGRSFIRGVAAY